MLVMLIGICNGKHKHKAMKINNTFLNGDKAEIETITHHNIEECYCDHCNNEPGNATTKPFVNIIYE